MPDPVKPIVKEAEKVEKAVPAAKEFSMKDLMAASRKINENSQKEEAIKAMQILKAQAEGNN